MATKRGSPNFTAFEREARRLQSLRGLNDWHLYVLHEPTQNKDAVANCNAVSTKRVATLRLNSKNKDRERKWIGPEEAARHEMVHVLLGEFSCIAGSRCVTSDEMEAAEEALVQRLIRLLPR